MNPTGTPVANFVVLRDEFDDWTILFGGTLVVERSGAALVCRNGE